MFYSRIRWLSKTLHPNAAVSAFLSHFRTYRRPNSQKVPPTHQLSASYSWCTTGLCAPIYLQSQSPRTFISWTIRWLRGTGVLKSDLAESGVNGQRRKMCFLLTSKRPDLISGILLQCHLVQKKVEAVRRPASREGWPSPLVCIQLTTFTPLTLTGFNLGRCWLTCKFSLGGQKVGLKLGEGGHKDERAVKTTPAPDNLHPHTQRPSCPRLLNMQMRLHAFIQVTIGRLRWRSCHEHLP